MKSELKKIAGLFSERMRASTCEACGKEFSCGASLKGCWCSEVTLSDETRANLKATYHDCLCRECLEKAQPSEVLGGDIE